MKYAYLVLFAIAVFGCSKQSDVISTIPPIYVDTATRLFVSVAVDSSAKAVVADSILETIDTARWNIRVTSNKNTPVVITGAHFRTTSFLITRMRIDTERVPVVSGNPDIVFDNLAIVVPPGKDGAVVSVLVSVGPLAARRARRWEIIYASLESFSYRSGSVRYGSGNTVRIALNPITVYSP